VRILIIAHLQVEILTLSHELSVHAAAVTQDIMWVTHNFGFLGGSLGCAEGEKIARAFELAVDLNIPVCVQVSSATHAHEYYTTNTYDQCSSYTINTRLMQVVL
jgi:acetyl-CoA carboxylase carboxyltransferase component